jgi:hypothetical protein
MRRCRKGYIRDMTREEFITILDDNNYLYKIVGDKISIIEKRFLGKTWSNIELEPIESIPPNIHFDNDLGYHASGDVFLSNLKALPHGIVFNNKGDVYLQSVETIHPSVQFNNKGDVKLKLFFKYLECNIDGIASNRLLNGMIKRGLFI